MHPGAEVARAAATPAGTRREAVEVASHPACEDAALAVHQRRRSEDLDVPVELVQPQGRPAPVLGGREPADAVLDQRDGAVRELEGAPGEIGVHEPVDGLRVEDHVLVVVMRPAHERRAVRLRIGPGPGRLGPDLAVDEPAGDQPGAVVVAARAPVPAQRCDGVREQHVAVHLGLDRARARDIPTLPLVPEPVEPCLQAIGDGEVPGVVEARRRRAAGGGSRAVRRPGAGEDACDRQREHGPPAPPRAEVPRGGAHRGPPRGAAPLVVRPPFLGASRGSRRAGPRHMGPGWRCAGATVWTRPHLRVARRIGTEG